MPVIKVMRYTPFLFNPLSLQIHCSAKDYYLAISHWMKSRNLRKPNVGLQQSVCDSWWRRFNHWRKLLIFKKNISSAFGNYLPVLIELSTPYLYPVSLQCSYHVWRNDPYLFPQAKRTVHYVSFPMLCLLHHECIRVDGKRSKSCGTEY